MCGAVQILLVDLFAVPVSGVLAHVDLVPGQVSHVLAVTQDLANRTRIPAPRRLVTAPAVADGRLGPAQFQFSADLSERPAEVSDGMKDEADDADFLFGPVLTSADDLTRCRVDSPDDAQAIGRDPAEPVPGLDPSDDRREDTARQVL